MATTPEIQTLIDRIAKSIREEWHEWTMDKWGVCSCLKHGFIIDQGYGEIIIRNPIRLIIFSRDPNHALLLDALVFAANQELVRLPPPHVEVPRLPPPPVEVPPPYQKPIKPEEPLLLIILFYLVMTIAVFIGLGVLLKR